MQDREQLRLRHSYWYVGAVGWLDPSNDILATISASIVAPRLGGAVVDGSMQVLQKQRSSVGGGWGGLRLLQRVRRAVPRPSVMNPLAWLTHRVDCRPAHLPDAAGGGGRAADKPSAHHV